ncbi:fructosamine kinase family protein [Vreelandella titanicae]|jgi:fructosamine-3-kinase|uniref:Fructosamine/Ketosamine-3-kinase n=1 Tax=Vreelandella titanicae BH1 TaxID=1204738 RepID=L9U9X2_9GAMM|nr:MULTISPECIES: fructosamine kinase family protein [Halomonas]NAO96600.1 phosphotransferase [Halomonas sp. MG34]ELY21629.1 Fructosamine/Ketosamine-3-kinase [Halomonas titanicae BH1]MCD1586183.1 fructosamine kinase family protein [Halomonas sp. IOP_14]NVE91018.1 fructosamine kinase family protein [Halomonas titanicae]PKH63518.1 aminoglycoside phosphotransferase [Halomonas sp. Choline-3u-9]|tara:strand:+ start:577 stop:1419 length:843 start_codon:yes stop_codon:yes gene_type:complete
MDATLSQLLESIELTPAGDLQSLSGGDIAAVYRLETRQGQVVIKHDDTARLRGEAEGLRALRGACSSLVVPEVLGLAEGWLIMESLDTVPAGQKSEAALGEGLRGLHSVIGDAHGWHQDNACGRTPQPNAPLSDGRAFQRERRLLPLCEACHQRGLLDSELRGRIERLAHDLERWLPDAPPSLLHGDLWSGNVLFTTKGPAIIDPAVYRHYPAVDVAMLTLFGSPGEAFFDAYWNGDAPTSWPRREALFQLYPLLNHLVLFGAGYRSAVERCVARLESFA